MIAEPRRWFPLDLAVRLTAAVRRANEAGYIDGKLLADATAAAKKLSDEDLELYRELVKPRGEA